MDPSSALGASSAGAPQCVVLVDDHVPQPAIGAGHPRGAAVLRALAARARTVDVCATQAPLPDPGPAEALPDNVRVAGEFGIAALARAMQAHAAMPGVLWIGRPNNMQLVDDLQRRRPDLLAGWRIVYDAEALFALRTAGERAIRGEAMSEHQRKRQLRAELRPAESAHRVVAVSVTEAGIIGEHVRRPLVVASYPATLRPMATPWRTRRDLLFVGAAPGMDGPNGDSLLQLLAGPMPALAADGTRLRVAGRGTGARGWLAAHAGANVELLGPVADLTPLYDAALAFVAPTRFGAGIPIKVLDAARHGLPVIATPFVAAQLGWRDGGELLVAHDLEGWVRAARRLARDEVLWHDLRERALTALQREHAPERFAARIGEAAFGDANDYNCGAR